MPLDLRGERGDPEELADALRSSGVAPTASAPLPYLVPMNGQRTRLIMLAVGAAVLVLCGGIGTAVFIFARGAASGGGFGSFHEWYSSEPCLVDANGDGTLDVAGFSGTPDQQTVPTALDGRTGKVLWTAAAYRENSRPLTAATRRAYGADGVLVYGA